MLTEPSFHANVECLHRYLVAIREKQPTKADRPEDDQELEFIKRDLTCICGLTRGICISVAASLCGVLVAYSGDCFEILESDHVITKHLAGGLRTAVRSWELFATALEEIDAKVTSHFCACFLDDFDAFVQVMRQYQPGNSE